MKPGSFKSSVVEVASMRALTEKIAMEKELSSLKELLKEVVSVRDAAIKELGEVREEIKNLKENKSLSVDLKRSRDNAVTELKELQIKYNKVLVENEFLKGEIDRKINVYETSMRELISEIERLKEKNFNLSERIKDITFQVGLHEIDKQSHNELSYKQKLNEQIEANKALDQIVSSQRSEIECLISANKGLFAENQSLIQELKLWKK